MAPLSNKDRQARFRELNPNYFKERAAERRKMLADIKLAQGCARCGYNEHPAALHFNHLDPTTKSFRIGSQVSRSWAKLEEEMAKCEVLCANCHAIHTLENDHHKPTRLPKT